MQKNVTKSEKKKKLTNSIKLDPLSCSLIPVIYINRYTISLKIVQFLNVFENKLFGGSPKMSTKYCVTKSEGKNTLHFFKICSSLREFSCHNIHLYKKKYTWSINVETVH